MNEVSKTKDLTHLDDEALHRSTELAAQDEQRACLVLLEHLIEVERRRLYAKKVYPTLHDYVRSLGYTDGQTQERIMAARLLKKVPEAKEAFEAKTLTVTTMAMIQRHSAREILAPAAIKELVKECESLSTREVQKVLVAESTVEVPAPDKIQPLSKKLTRITLEVDDEFLELLKRTKELKGNPGASLAELFTATMKDYVKKREVKKQEVDARRIETQESKIPTQLESFPVGHASGKTSPPNTVRSSPQKSSFNKTRPLDESTHSLPISILSRTASLTITPRIRTRYIPTKIKNALRIRSNDQCERIDENTGRRCSGRVGLEADHYPVPFGKGGSTTLTNLRWVCRAHNVEFAIQAYGSEKMNSYLR